MNAPSRRLRVVQVSFHLDSERRAADVLLRAWPTLPAVASAASSADVEVIVVQAAHASERVDVDGVAYHFVEDGTRTRTRVIDRVATLEPDVVHVHGLGFVRPMRPLAKALRGIPILVQDHGSVLPKGLRRHAWRWAYDGIAGVAFTAREQVTPWKQAKILRADLPVFEVLEGSSDFTPGDLDAARATTAMFGDPCLLWTGRLDANKDPLMMLGAFEQAAKRLPDARLWCCFGTSPMLADVEQRIASSPELSQRVVLLGTRPHEELELRFRAADFFVQASHREGSGYSVIEALACGTTPLVTDIPAVRKIVGSAGSLTPVDDAAALTDAMCAWAARDRVSLRRTARARFENALTFEVLGKELRAAYFTLAGSVKHESVRAPRELAADFAHANAEAAG
ncbi:MAG: glycosyltransferase family 4 protein [bacterium]